MGGPRRAKSPDLLRHLHRFQFDARSPKIDNSFGFFKIDISPMPFFPFHSSPPRPPRLVPGGQGYFAGIGSTDGTRRGKEIKKFFARGFVDLNRKASALSKKPGAIPPQMIVPLEPSHRQAPAPATKIGIASMQMPPGPPANVFRANCPVENRVAPSAVEAALGGHAAFHQGEPFGQRRHVNQIQPAHPSFQPNVSIGIDQKTPPPQTESAGRIRQSVHAPNAGRTANIQIEIILGPLNAKSLTVESKAPPNRGGFLMDSPGKIVNPQKAFGVRRLSVHPVGIPHNRKRSIEKSAHAGPSVPFSEQGQVQIGRSEGPHPPRRRAVFSQ
jgi:hypothetical protein